MKFLPALLIPPLFTVYHLFWMKTPRAPLQAYDLFRFVFAPTHSFLGTYHGLISLLLSFYAFYNKNADLGLVARLKIELNG